MLWQAPTLSVQGLPASQYWHSSRVYYSGRKLLLLTKWAEQTSKWGLFEVDVRMRWSLMDDCWDILKIKQLLSLDNAFIVYDYMKPFVVQHSLSAEKTWSSVYVHIYRDIWRPTLQSKRILFFFIAFWVIPQTEYSCSHTGKEDNIYLQTSDAFREKNNKWKKKC